MTELKAQNEDQYGPEYKAHLFEQYKIYIEGIEKTSDRRQQANNYFITINAALISLIGLSLFKEVIWIKVVLAIVGMVISIIFWFLIRSYRQLNTGKFAVVHEIEKLLPLQLYAYEWDEKLAKGDDKDVYYPFSHIESHIPLIFGVIYAVLIIFLALSRISIIPPSWHLV